MNAYHALARSYDRLTQDVDYEATLAFYYEILKREGVKPRTAVDLACGTGSIALLMARVLAVVFTSMVMFIVVQDMQVAKWVTWQPIKTADLALVAE